jgi:hypothetical protein
LTLENVPKEHNYYCISRLFERPIDFSPSFCYGYFAPPAPHTNGDLRALRWVRVGKHRRQPHAFGSLCGVRVGESIAACDCVTTGFLLCLSWSTLPGWYGGGLRWFGRSTLNKQSCSVAYPEAAAEINPFLNPSNPPSNCSISAFYSTYASRACRIFHSVEHGALENPESLMTAMRKRQREDEDTSDFMTVLAGAMLLPTGQGSSVWFPHRKIQRAAGGAMGSIMWGYYNHGYEKTFLYNFRMTKDQLEGGHRMLAEGGHLHDSQSRRVEYILFSHLEFFHQRSPILVKDQRVPGNLWR